MKTNRLVASVSGFFTALLPVAAENICPEGHEKDSTYLFSLDASVKSDTEMGLDLASSLRVGQSWKTMIGGGASGNFRSFDWNRDGFMDTPERLRFLLSNRWLYSSGGGTRMRFSLRACQDMSRGGQHGYDHETFSIYAPDVPGADPWGSDIVDRSLDASVGVLVPVSDDSSHNLAIGAAYSLKDTDSWYGATSYMGQRHSLSANIRYRIRMDDSHEFALGADGSFGRYGDDLDRTVWILGPAVTASGAVRDFGNAGLSGEYAFHAGNRFNAVAVLGADWYSAAGFRIVPEVSLEYVPVDGITVRAAAERSLGYAFPLADNPGVFLTGKTFRGDFENCILEDAWTFGGSVTYSFRSGAAEIASLSLGYSRTQYLQQSVTDYEMSRNTIWFYSLDGNRSRSDNFQIDFSVCPVERCTVSATFRYTDAKIELRGKGLVEKPMTERFRGILNFTYATVQDRWTFGFNAALNGPCRVYDFMLDATDEDGDMLYGNGYTPVYPILDARVTRRFKCVDVYVGGENLANFRQKHVVFGTVGADGVVNPRLQSFDASAVWGPVTGIRFYAGVRFFL